jgi:sulfoxide reductase catalytic subunit YedY
MAKFKNLAAGVGLSVITALMWLVSACSQPQAMPVPTRPPDIEKPASETNTTTTTAPPAFGNQIPGQSSTTTTTPQTTPTTSAPITTESPITSSAVDNVDITSFRVNINGLVNTPAALSLEQIEAYPAVTQNAEIVCPDVEDEWDEWTGVPLATLLKEAGLESGASEVVFTGLDGYHIQLPLESVLQDGVFLAYKINGETLTKERGYPLRLVVKSSLGNYWMRWVTKIEVQPALVTFSNSAAIIRGLSSNVPTAGNKLCSCLLNGLRAPFKL